MGGDLNGKNITMDYGLSTKDQPQIKQAKPPILGNFAQIFYT